MGKTVLLKYRRAKLRFGWYGRSCLRPAAFPRSFVNGFTSFHAFMKPTLVLVLFCFVVARAFPYGEQGHRTISAIALPLLTPSTLAAVNDILDGESLLDASMWPDDIKKGHRLSLKPEAVTFNTAHADNGSWHFVNFPIATKKYTLSSPFASPHDIVHLINGCITVLEGGSFNGLSQKEALRFLAHLVGDLHQPLHVVTGYYDLSDPQHPKLETTVAGPHSHSKDGGGNALAFGPGAADNLHSLWDTKLVNDLLPGATPQALATEVMQGAPAPSTFKSTGKYTTWAGKWAAESMTVAKLAYSEIQFGAADLDDDDHLKITVTLLPSESAYRAKYKGTVKDQLRKAGVHLAQLLNAIQWDETP